MQSNSLKPIKIQEPVFYFSVASIATFALLTFSYLILRLNSSLGLLYIHNSIQYFYSYLVLTLSTSLFFGVNVTLFVYQARRYGIRNLFQQGGSGIGAVIGLIASSCPVCGSTVLSLVGVLGGLSALPFQGLELKVLSLLIVMASVIYSVVLLTRQSCNSASCPTPRRPKQIKSLSTIMTFGLASLLVFLVNWHLLRTDPIVTSRLLHSTLTCSSQKV